MVLIGLVTCALAATAQPLVSVTEPATVATLTRNQVEAELAESAEGPALQVTFSARTEWPNLRFAAGTAFAVTDWRDAAPLVFKLTNQEQRAVTVACRVDDDPRANGSVYCRQGSVELPAGATRLVAMPLASATGMRGSPPVAPGALEFRPSAQPLELSHIVAFQLFLPRPKADATLLLHSVELHRGSLTGFVDRFGQYNGAEWPGKLANEAEWPALRAAEEADLAGRPSPLDRNAYGGWSAGPQLRATGRFRVEKVDGRWWLVDPEGRLFWAAGVTGVRPFAGGPIKGRESYFTWLPADDDALAKYYQRQSGYIDFHAINIERKYGAEPYESWQETAHRRLRSWGFTTIANWSDARLFDDRRTAYVVPVSYSCPTIETGYHRPFPDVFNEAFSRAVDAAMAKASRGDDPWCIGYFVDNELGWGPWGGARAPLSTAILALPGDQAVKQRLVGWLRERHASLEALNEALGTKLTSWDELAAPIKLPDPVRAAALSGFETLLAERYFTICREAVRKHAPGALYLGCRFAARSPEAVAVAGRLCDVVSFNFYNRSPLERSADVAVAGDAPVMIGEFHFGALDRGMFHTGLVATGSQTERAEAFGRYMTDALGAPWCVGAHWFQYVDQQLTGRFDGENYNIGFVTGTDTPYPEMVAAAREVLYRLYPTRAGAE